DTPDQVEMDRIRDKRINGFLTIPADALDGGVVVYRGDNGSNPIVEATLGKLVPLVVMTERGKRAKLDENQLKSILLPTEVKSEQTNGKSEATAGQLTFLVG